jgi:hypothetical protein
MVDTLKAAPMFGATFLCAPGAKILLVKTGLGRTDSLNVIDGFPLSPCSYREHGVFLRPVKGGRPLPWFMPEKTGDGTSQKRDHLSRRTLSYMFKLSLKSEGVISNGIFCCIIRVMLMRTAQK